MGLVESKISAQVVKPIIRQDGFMKLPSFSMDTAKFSDGSSGFVITTVDLAKNSTVRTISVKLSYSPAENIYVFVGNDETIISFVRDLTSGNIVCSIVTVTRENITRFCVTTYEPIEDEVIDKIGKLYLKQSQISS